MRKFRRSIPLVLAIATAAALGACSSGSGATPSPTPTGSAAEQVASLARAGTAAYYTAQYALQSATAANSATVTIRRTPAAYRVDIVTKGSDAILLRNKAGAYSCERKTGKKATCFYVAREGKPIPPAFDAGVQKVFGTYLALLSTSAQLYDVAAVESRPAVGALPEGRCFSVTPGASSPTQNAVAAGTYCFSNNGIPMHVVFPSGTLDIRSLALETPAPVLLLPPARATPIPGV